MASFAIFDENFYLSNYPDVAAVVAARIFNSGLDHFIQYGLGERRLLVSPNYDERTYLERYPDVAAVVAAGSFSSGLDHFIHFGEAEGRNGIPLFPDGAINTGRGRSTGQDNSGENNPADYNTPGDGSKVNEWEQSFDGLWVGTADVQFVNGRTTTIPLQILDDEAFVDGDDILIWEIGDGASFGFSQETYLFSENDARIGDNDDIFENNGVVPIELRLNSTIKIATIIIQDNDNIFPPITGDAVNNSLFGSDSKDIIYAREGNDNIEGGFGDDDLYGEAGDDTLLGNLGNDYLNGSSGNDYLDGNTGNDLLDGLTGDDSLYGGAGDDTLGGYSGNDYLDGGDDNDYLYGDADNDTLVGGFGNDTLLDGAGSDILIGGAGDDNYSVDSITDIITEYFNEGTDIVESSVSFTLGDNIESLTLTGNSDISGTGNALDNTIVGDSNNNYLFGRDGNDLLRGEDRLNDDDIDYNNNDTLYGEAGNDTLIRSPGNDILLGGAGADTFTIDGSYGYYLSSDGIATVIDFNSSEGDKFAVSTSVLSYGGRLTIGELLPEQFTIGSAAADESDRFIYDSSTGGLFYDPDGTGSITTDTGYVFVNEQTQLALLSPGLNLISSDISIIA